MKNVSVFVGMFVIALLLWACKDNGRIKISYRVQYDRHDTSIGERMSNILEFDSVVFSDGSYAIYQQRCSPQNSLYEFFNKEGRVIATVAQASECYEQVIVYKYDDNGRLANLLYFYGGSDESEKYSDWYGGSSMIDYETLRSRIETVDIVHPDTTKYLHFSIEYDREGKASIVRNVNTGKVIEAPKEYMLDVNIGQCTRFWESDLHGGYYIFKVCVKPKITSVKDYTLFHYADFEPVLEENFRNGLLVRATVYANKGHSDSRTWTKSFSKKNGDNIYSSYEYGNGDTLKTVWRNHYLISKQRVSQYGTVLEQDTYLYELPSSQVKAIHEKLDFESMKMKNVSESFITLFEIGKEEDEMKLLKYDCSWHNVYTEDELY